MVSEGQVQHLCLFCSGDSGGPLIIPHDPDRKISDGLPQFDSLIALTSFGDADCSRLEQPGAYTLIAPYLVWIESIMNGRKGLGSPKVFERMRIIEGCDSVFKTCFFSFKLFVLFQACSKDIESQRSVGERSIHCAWEKFQN